MKDNFAEAMGDDATVMKKTRTLKTPGVTEAKFCVFYSVKLKTAPTLLTHSPSPTHYLTPLGLPTRP